LVNFGADPATARRVAEIASREEGRQPARKPDRRAETSAANGEKGGRPPAPMHAICANEFADACLRTPDKHLTTRHHHGLWYTYRPVAGWREISEREIEGRLTTFLREQSLYRPHATSNYVRSVILNLRAHDLCGIPEHVERPIWLASGESAANCMAFSDGAVVDVWAYAQALASKTAPPPTRTASPDLFSGDFVPYPWNPEQLPERWHKYLDRVQPDPEQSRAVARMLGLLMTDQTKYEVFFQLYGNGKNGKSQTLEIISRLVGAHNVSAVPLTGLIEQFQSWPLAFSKVNICGELPTDIGRGQFHAIEGAFKDAVSGGYIEVEKKMANKFLARCRARFVLSANSLPTFIDRSDAIWRRLRIIPYPVQIPPEERIPDYAAWIAETDLPGIAAWALDGMAEVIRARDCADCLAGLDHKNRHRQTCDHERQFLTENYASGDGFVPGQEIYDAFRAWSIENGYKAVGAAKFYARVQEVFSGATYTQHQTSGERTRGFYGIRSVA
jgi:putative DNA primase/helicase